MTPKPGCGDNVGVCPSIPLSPSPSLLDPHSPRNVMTHHQISFCHTLSACSCHLHSRNGTPIVLMPRTRTQAESSTTTQHHHNIISTYFNLLLVLPLSFFSSSSSSSLVSTTTSPSTPSLNKQSLSQTPIVMKTPPPPPPTTTTRKKHHQLSTFNFQLQLPTFDIFRHDFRYITAPILGHFLDHLLRVCSGFQPLCSHHLRRSLENRRHLHHGPNRKLTVSLVCSLLIL